MKRLECLDGLRGVLAVYVLLGHMAPFAALPDVVQQAVSHGEAAVNLFFMLSGLVITQSLKGTTQAVPFLMMRVARLFPVYLAVFAVAVAVQPLSCGFEYMPWIDIGTAARSICSQAWPATWAPELIAHLTMTHGLLPDGVVANGWISFLGSAWSLSTEWQFYLLALVITGRMHRPCVVLIGLAVAGLAWRIGGPDAWQFSRAFLPNKAHFFALGMVSVPVVARAEGAFGRYVPILLACLALCAADGAITKMLPPLAWTLCLLVQMRLPILGLGLAGRLLRSNAAQFLGVISYCIYLVNEPLLKVLGLVLGRMADGNAMQFAIMWVIMGLGGSIAVSAWLHLTLEAPALRWGRNFAAQLKRERLAVAVHSGG